MLLREASRVKRIGVGAFVVLVLFVVNCSGVGPTKHPDYTEESGSVGLATKSTKGHKKNTRTSGVINREVDPKEREAGTLEKSTLD